MISATYCFLSDGLGNVGHGLLISNSVTNANTETEKPEVNDHLDASEKLASYFGTLYAKYDMHQTPLRCSDRLLPSTILKMSSLLIRTPSSNTGFDDFGSGDR